MLVAARTFITLQLQPCSPALSDPPPPPSGKDCSSELIPINIDFNKRFYVHKAKLHLRFGILLRCCEVVRAAAATTILSVWLGTMEFSLNWGRERPAHINLYNPGRLHCGSSIKQQCRSCLERELPCFPRTCYSSLSFDIGRASFFMTN